ncbi:hypothetical protein ACFYYL_36880 [Actinomadura geliboluensis]|uniref:hypothetical protein n=1 Tax=Actinomadura geliboluensis TaxID=882440 RepID=UPI0036C56908
MAVPERASEKLVETPTELARLIHFALSELGSENGHHEFEHLCRELARARMVSNILPATGPVAGGGDQGRDFETFRTYLAGSLRFSKGFIGLASQDTVAFACTLQQDDLSSKIKKDVASVCTQGTPVQQIYFFCTKSVKVSVRHDMQDWAAEEYQASLTVIDGPGIAELLADHEIFWIAQTYLRIPAVLCPESPPSEPAVPDWYSALKDTWAPGGRHVENLGEMMQVVEGLRYATDNRGAREDLDDWLNLMEGYLPRLTDATMTQRARYEISRAMLRGTGDLRPAENHVQAYFADVETMTDPIALLDASSLLQYLGGASRNGESSLDPADVEIWSVELSDHVKLLLENAVLPGRRAGLLNVAARLSLRLNIGALEDTEPPEQPAAEAHKYMAPDDITHVEIPSGFPLVDRDEGMRALLELIELLPRATLFPVGSLANIFDMLTAVLVDHPLYPQVRSGLDEATDRQAGQVATAERCRKRAMTLYKNGKRLAALRELHEAKVSWWQADTVRQSILAMLFIAHIYGELNLPQAAKKYALAAGYAALNVENQKVTDLAPRAIFAAAHFDHQCGAWVSALELRQVAMLLQAHYRADPWNIERYEDLGVAIVNSAVAKVASRHRPVLAGRVEALIALAGLATEVDDVLALEDNALYWGEEKLRLQSEQEMTGPPFSDTAELRTFSFGALGQSWRVRCANDPSTVIATEEFCSAVQLVVAEFANDDPVLVNSTIDIEIETYDADSKPADLVKPVPDNTAVRWKVFLPEAAANDAGHPEVETLATLAAILHGSSLLPWEKFEAVLDRAGRKGLMNKLGMVSSYRVTAEYFRTEHQLVQANPLGDPSRFPIRESPELAAPISAGPGYSHEKALEAIEARYEGCSAVVRHTLPRILADPTAKEMLRRSVSEGRPEWIVLMALSAIVANFRLFLRYGPLFGPLDSQSQQRAAEEMRREERADDPAPSVSDVLNKFELQLGIVTVTIVKFWGLEINRATPDFAAIENVLRLRYRFWDDDVDHARYFTD